MSARFKTNLNALKTHNYAVRVPASKFNNLSRIMNTTYSELMAVPQQDFEFVQDLVDDITSQISEERDARTNQGLLA
mgnify:FL=1